MSHAPVCVRARGHVSEMRWCKRVGGCQLSGGFNGPAAFVQSCTAPHLSFARRGLSQGPLPARRHYRGN